MNKVGPYYNIHETYHYYSLPVCHPDQVQTDSSYFQRALSSWRSSSFFFLTIQLETKIFNCARFGTPFEFRVVWQNLTAPVHKSNLFQIVHRSLTLGEVLEGDRMAAALYDIKFRGNTQTVVFVNHTNSFIMFVNLLQSTQLMFLFALWSSRHMIYQNCAISSKICITLSL